LNDILDIVLFSSFLLDAEYEMDYTKNFEANFEIKIIKERKKQQIQIQEEEIARLERGEKSRKRKLLEAAVSERIRQKRKLEFGGDQQTACASMQIKNAFKQWMLLYVVLQIESIIRSRNPPFPMKFMSWANGIMESIIDYPVFTVYMIQRIKKKIARLPKDYFSLEFLEACSFEKVRQWVISFPKKDPNSGKLFIDSCQEALNNLQTSINSYLKNFKFGRFRSNDKKYCLFELIDSEDKLIPVSPSNVVWDDWSQILKDDVLVSTNKQVLWNYCFTCKSEQRKICTNCFLCIEHCQCKVKDELFVECIKQIPTAFDENGKIVSSVKHDSRSNCIICSMCYKCCKCSLYWKRVPLQSQFTSKGRRLVISPDESEF